MPSDVRIHYTIVDGGVAPNIVPDKAVVWYYMRGIFQRSGGKCV